ncbi:MAG: PqqD family protein, partial [Candidatus Omnitrophica bacterium]|nr:PqqD family protein [Candidatus Omnitrophota bacterium]
MDLAQKYAINEEQITYRVIDGEAIVLNLEDAYYYGLNTVATEILELIDRKKNLCEILKTLQKEYSDIPVKQLKSDLLSLIK